MRSRAADSWTMTRIGDALGVSQRQAAKVLWVAHKTIQRDLAQSAPKSGAQSATNTPETKARRAAVAAKASSKGVTDGSAALLNDPADHGWPPLFLTRRIFVR